MHREQRRTRKLKSRDREVPPLPPIYRSRNLDQASWWVHMEASGFSGYSGLCFPVLAIKVGGDGA